MVLVTKYLKTGEVMAKKVTSVFTNQDAVDALEQTIEQSVARIKAIANAYIDESLDPSQYQQATKSLNFALENLDEAQSKIEDSLSGREDFAEIMDESSNASVLMHNIAMAKMSASVCCSSIMGDMEDEMSLEDALDVPEDEIDDVEDGVDEPSQALEKEQAAVSTNNDDIVPPVVNVVPAPESVIKVEDELGTSENEDDIDDMDDLDGDEDDIDEPEVPLEGASANSIFAGTNAQNLSKQVYAHLLS